MHKRQQRNAGNRQGQQQQGFALAQPQLGWRHAREPIHNAPQKAKQQGLQHGHNGGQHHHGPERLAHALHGIVHKAPERCRRNLRLRMFPIQIGKRIDEVFKKTQHGKNQRSDAWRLLQTGDAGATTRAQNQMSQDQQIGSINLVIKSSCKQTFAAASGAMGCKHYQRVCPMACKPVQRHHAPYQLLPAKGRTRTMPRTAWTKLLA